jgi:DNA polymerase-3 subunit alpha
MSGFVHLHNHTHYSLQDAVTTPKELVNAAIADGHESVALTDHGVMFGVVEFYNYAKSKSIKPIIGMEGYLSNGTRFERIATNKIEKRRNYFHILLLAKDNTGYKNLCKLTSLSHTEGFYYKPRFDKELLEKYHDGLICTTACMGSMVNAWLIDGEYEKALSEAQYYKDLFSDDFYIELQRHGLENDKIILDNAPKIATELGLKIIVTNDIHYVSKDFAVPHNILLSIKESTKGGELIDITKLRYGTPEYYFKTEDQMRKLFHDFPEGLANTLEIADKCNFELDKNKVYPEFPIPKESKADTLAGYLTELVEIGLHKRFSEITDEIKERIEYELGVINDMGFPGYFLIVWDFIEAAKRLGVSVGPGRGSVVGSLVAYVLGITNVNPLPYDLLFERFLNPERYSMPDIDIDFSDETREKIIEYVKMKYGANAVAQIVTFGKLSTRAAFTDVGRVLGVDLKIIKDITKQIPVVRGKVTKIGKAIELPELEWLKDTNDDNIKRLVEFSGKLEDRNRNTGIHAAGIVITPGDITDYVPVYKTSEKGKEQSIDIATQYSMTDLEDIGLLKMDFLGLRTLSIIDHTLEMIEKNHGIKIEIDAIDFDDKKTYDMISAGDTLGIFQFESSGMQDYLKKLKPHNLEELTAMNALYRPGPMENIPDFIDRKYGRKEIEYLHPLMAKVLKNTYGIIVYQEQVMQLVQTVGNFTLGEADILRRAMGKKKMSEMEKMKPKFLVGAANNGIEEKLALEIYDLVFKFADYGFNKSHSLAYSYLAFQTAWLKSHYPVECLASNMTAELDDQDKIVQLIEEAKKFNIKVLPPDLNRSFATFSVQDKTIFFGMAAIKGVGVNAVDAIVEARKEKPFKSFFDFVARVDNKMINRRALEALICAGAFDSIHLNKRTALFDSIESGIEYAKSFNVDTTMDSLFGAPSEDTTRIEPQLPNVIEWSEKEKLEKEKEVLSFYVSGHPMREFEPFIRSFTNINLAEKPFEKRDNVRLCGMISEIRLRRDQKNNSIAFVTVEDFNGKSECIFWSNTYEKYAHLLHENELVIVTGKLNESDDIAKIVVNEVVDIDDAIIKLAKCYKIWINIDEINAKQMIIELYEKLCNASNRNTKIMFYLNNNDKSFRKSYISYSVPIEINMKTIKKLCDIFGTGFVQIGMI